MKRGIWAVEIDPKPDKPNRRNQKQESEGFLTHEEENIERLRKGGSMSQNEQPGWFTHIVIDWDHAMAASNSACRLFGTL